MDSAFLSRLPTHERRLGNGLTVLVREDPSAPVVAIMTRVRAGYFDEPDRLVGISHVLEHMFFKGTERRGVGEIARETKAAGGYLNAGTIYDYTSYYTVLPSSALERGLDIQSDALRNSEIDEGELAKELLVIIQEAKRKLDSPPAVATETLYAEMFDVDRLRRWRIGTEEGLERLTREDVRCFYRDLYRPSNIVLSITGDVDPERTFALVERFYGDMPAGEPVRDEAPEEPERRGFRFRELAGDIAQTYAEWGWRTPGTLDSDTPALDLLAVVLGQGRASRLYRGVREPGWATGIGAYNYTPTRVGVFGVSAELLPEDTRPALEATRAVVEAVRRDGVSEPELVRAKNILEARLVRRTETAEGQARLLARWQALGDWRGAERYLERLSGTTAADLRRVAREHLPLDRATLLAYRPDEANELGWDAAAVESMLADEGAEAVGPPEEAERGRGGAEGGRVGHGRRASRSDRRGIHRRSAARGSVPTVEIEDGVHFYELDNGVRIAVRPRHAAPLVSLRIACRGGVLDETPERAGITGLMAQTSIKGTERRSAAELAEETEALGGSVSAGVGSDLFHWTLALPGRHFSRGFELLADAALRPTFPAEELERERKVALSDLEQLRDDMFRYPMRLLLTGAFGGHPYGASVAEKEEAVAALGAPDLERWHRRHVMEARPWALIVGDVDPDEAAAVAARELEGLSTGGPESETAGPAWPSEPRETVERREKKQTALALGFPGPERNHPDSYATDVLSSAVSGLGNRLFVELRDGRSLAYTVAAYPIARWLGGALVAYIATSPEREEEARAGLLEQFDLLASDGITREELERSKRYTIGAWHIHGQTNTARLGELTGALLLGEGVEEIRAFEDRIRAVTRERVREVAARYFDRNRLVEGIVRGNNG